MKTVIEKILASGGEIEIEAYKEDNEDGTTNEGVSIFARFGHIGRRATGKTLEEALKATLNRMTVESAETAQMMAEESAAIAKITLAYFDAERAVSEAAAIYLGREVQ